MTIIYGIHNCDTVKKAITWLNKQEISFTFHDFRKDGLSETLLKEFFTNCDWQLLLNKRSTTYRNLPDEIKNNLNEDNIFKAILEQPTLLKRPVLAHNQQLNLGFKPEQYQELFS